MQVIKWLDIENSELSVWCFHEHKLGFITGSSKQLLKSPQNRRTIFQELSEVYLMSNLREMHYLFHMALYHLTPANGLILINNDFLLLLAFLILILVMPFDKT